MDFIAEIRRHHFISDESISSIALSLNLSRTTVRKHLKTIEEPVINGKSIFSKLGEFQSDWNNGWIQNLAYPKNKEDPHSVCLKVYSRRLSWRLWQCTTFCEALENRTEEDTAATKAFIPLAFLQENVPVWLERGTGRVGGIPRKIKVGHFRLSYSRKMFVVAYPCETQEMVLDAHNKAFVFFGGVPLRMVSALYLLHPCSRTTIRNHRWHCICGQGTQV